METLGQSRPVVGVMHLSSSLLMGLKPRNCPLVAAGVGAGVVVGDPLTLQPHVAGRGWREVFSAPSPSADQTLGPGAPIIKVERLFLFVCAENTWF